MNILADEINRNIDMLEKAITFIEKQNVTDEKVSLKICPDRYGNLHYYQQTTKDKCISTKFLKKDSPLAGLLATKSYYQHILPVLRKELAVLLRFRDKYQPNQKYEIYEQLSEERKKLVTPLFSTPEYKAAIWEKEEWKRYDGFPEKLVYDTEAGEKVRSKSERTIANMLYDHRDVLCYRYEQEIYLPKSRIYVHPDFTVMNKHSGKIFYWEHVGRLDKEDYLEDFISKMNAYALDGLFPADNFILTFEGPDNPENRKTELKMLELLLKG